MVEAKFGAELSIDQVDAYLANQEGRLEGEMRGALILLVPSYRKPEAETLLGALGPRADEQNARATSVSTAVVTWDEWLDVIDQAAREFPAEEQGAVLCDPRPTPRIVQNDGRAGCPASRVGGDRARTGRTRG